MKCYYVYILTNDWGNVMYIGVTNDLERRLFEHRQELADGFTKKIMFINWSILKKRQMCGQRWNGKSS